MAIIKGMTRRDEMWGVRGEIKPLSQTAELILSQGIPSKEYTACREAERRVSTTSKSTSGEEENWDEEPPLTL